MASPRRCVERVLVARPLVDPVPAGDRDGNQERAAVHFLTCASHRRLSVPIRSSRGDHSAASFPAAARRAGRTLPNVVVTPIPGAGRVLHHDRPDAVLDAAASLTPSDR